MEDFSSLPRLYRDAAVNELWEGPRNVLLTQIHRDFQRVSDWYKPADFVASILAGADSTIIKEMGEEMNELISYSDIFTMDEETMEVCNQWDRFCHRLAHEYQDNTLSEVESAASVRV